ncbi:hypothetical protein [Pelagibacterium sp. H642]|uniref:hypothetical protein n=1 Tax=Pelagibacterium sp. H642 TaxID=1881069 RepID=UPI002814C575|nr:hypothetical protein [Pelagibacterium sp. H642]WMT92707.1 hypothetical protein NO934_20450 [Pelagibacterium sp. H642]
MKTTVVDFDYAARAELYPGKRSRRLRTIGYHRFDTTAEALRYAIEQMPPELMADAIIETAQHRFGADQITELYADDAYPLPRV